jgi:hypothetical protein
MNGQKVYMHSILKALKSPILAKVTSILVGLSVLGSLLIWLTMLGHIPPSLNGRYTIARAHFLGMQSHFYQAVFIASSCLQFTGSVFLWNRESPATVCFVVSFTCSIYEMFVYREIAFVNSTHKFSIQMTNVILGVLWCAYVWWATSRKMEHPA